MAILAFKLNKSLFLRDPQSSELGQKIILSSIELINSLGFEQFTFKKLAEHIGSTEASVYRYFENKHRLLLYLIDWYWTWLEYRIDFKINNISDPKDQLRICIRELAEEKQFDTSIAFVNERALQQIVMAEFEKTYLTKQVDSDNKEGVFLPYKSLCKKIATLVTKVNPEFLYPSALVSTVLLTVNHQLFYAEHLPSLTDIKYNPKTHYKKLQDFLEQLVFNSLQV